MSSLLWLVEWLIYVAFSIPVVAVGLLAVLDKVGILHRVRNGRYSMVSAVLAVTCFWVYVVLLSRGSEQADIEVNPGPHWHDDPVRHEMRAVVGLVKQQQDVRVILLLVGTPLARLEPAVQAFVANDATARYYRDVGMELQPAGGSPASVAKAFRAVYQGAVRRSYVDHVIGQRTVDAGVLAAVRDIVAEVVGSSTGMDGSVPATKLRELPSPEQGDEMPQVPVTGDASGKQYCSECKFWVNPVNHESRCGVTYSFENTAAAWMGDALHKLDVRAVLLKAGVAHRELTVVQDQFTRATAQANYLLRIFTLADLQLPEGTSSKVFSTIFEREYKGDFRVGYLKWLQSYVAEMYPRSETYNLNVEEYHQLLTE